MHPVSTGVALVGGAIAGSAAGVALHRWPQGDGLSSPRRSRCDACGMRLAVRDLVPVLSWLLRRGRCRSCGAAIDPRLLVLEGGAALLVAAVIATHGVTVTGVILAAGTVAVLTAALIDLEHRIVPDRLTIPLGVVVLAALPLMVPPSRIAEAAALALLVPAALHGSNLMRDRLGRDRVIGAGDLKLLVPVLAMAEVVRGGSLAVLLLAVVAGGVAAVIGLVTGRLTRRSRLPFAPAIGVAHLLVALAPGVALSTLSPFGGAAWSV